MGSLQTPRTRRPVIDVATPERRANESTSLRERIGVVDAVRGVAVLGILVVNIAYMGDSALYRSMLGSPTTDSTTLDSVVGFGIGWLVAGKFLACFSILFGVSVFLTIDRADPVAARGPLRRRFLLLGLFGIAHMTLLFPGDILFVYGVTGLLLLPFLGRAGSVVLRWSGGLLAFAAASSVLVALLTSTTVEAASRPSADPVGEFLMSRHAAAQEAFASGSYADVLGAHAWEALIVQTGQLLMVPWLLGLFLLGLGLGKSGVVHALDARPRQLARVAVAGLAIGLPLNVVLGEQGPTAMGAVLSAGGPDSTTAVLSSLAVTLGAPVLAVAYLCLAVLACQRLGTGGRLAALGRMSLTAYLTQSLAGLAIFFGLRLYERLSLTESMLVVLVIWAVQLALAERWLQHVRHGPAEWLLRAATYRTTTTTGVTQ